MATTPSGAASYKGGYDVVHEAANNLFNLAFVLPLLALTSPLFVFVALLVLATSGRPVLYRGTRLGRGKRLFTMYKFRTLVPDAETIIGARVLGAEHRRVVTPVGLFLRSTRLDELPQLVNVLRRDMDIFGPRPQRPAVYEAICRHIKGYDRRFLVNPGLIGYPQLFLPHNAPKRLQSLVDNRFLWKQKRISWEILMVFFTSWVVLRKVLQKGARAAHDLTVARARGVARDKRELERLQPKQASVEVRAADAGPEGALLGVAELLDINEKACLIRSSEPLPAAEAGRFDLVISFARLRGRERRKRARCRGRIAAERPGRGAGHLYVVDYTPLSSFNFYLLHQYFLRGSMVS